MEPLHTVNWDVLIIGTSLAQSLLALSLSRSALKVLHIDASSLYGGSEAAVSLQDAEDLTSSSTTLSRSSGAAHRIGNAHGIRNIHITQSNSTSNSSSKLAFPRAYSLALAPQIIYTRSALIPALVSSKVYRQLEFLAVGNWFIFDFEGGEEHTTSPSPSVGTSTSTSTESESGGRLRSIPSSREDIFAAKDLDLRAKRALVKFIKVATATSGEECDAFSKDHGDERLDGVLERQFGMGKGLRDSISALTLLPRAHCATVREAIPRVARHLSSIGVFGPGFGSVIPKWGGLSEVTQVSCRAGAVGGAVYALGRTVQSQSWDEKEERWTVDLGDGDVISTKHVVRSATKGTGTTYRSISIVSDGLASLFITDAERTKSSAAVVVFPAGSVSSDEKTCSSPIYVSVHSCDTGECPAGQCVVYAQTFSDEDFSKHLEAATRLLLRSIPTTEESGNERPEILWSMTYTIGNDESSTASHENKNEILLEPLSSDLAFDDAILRQVRGAWQTITGEEDGFLAFEDREVGAYDDEDDQGSDLS